MTGGLMIETCLYCGKELQKPRKLKDFCSYAHRGKYEVKALDGAEYQSGLSGSKNTNRNKALRTLQKQSRGTSPSTALTPSPTPLMAPESVLLVGLWRWLGLVAQGSAESPASAIVQASNYR
jgi:hypothetical protein